MRRTLRFVIAVFAVLVLAAAAATAVLWNGSRRAHAAVEQAMVALDALPAGADLDAPLAGGLAALAWAAREGRVEEIERLLAAGADPEVVDARNGWTPLIHAVHHRQDAAAAALLAGGADPDHGSGRWTPLVMAAAYGDTPLVELLLDAGADPYRPGGENPLVAAAWGTSDVDARTLGACQTETVRVLRRRAPELAMPRTVGTRIRFAWLSLRGCDDEIRLLQETPAPPRL